LSSGTLANKALHPTAIPLRSIAAGELNRYLSFSKWDMTRLGEMLASKELGQPIKTLAILAFSLVIFTAMYYNL